MQFHNRWDLTHCEICSTVKPAAFRAFDNAEAVSANPKKVASEKEKPSKASSEKPSKKRRSKQKKKAKPTPSDDDEEDDDDGGDDDDEAERSVEVHRLFSLQLFCFLFSPPLYSPALFL